MTKIILFNGPPGCGKDYAANFVNNNFEGVRIDKFARILKEKTHALYGFPWKAWDYYEDCKDEPNEDFFGLTPRKAYINVSEKYFKPVHGDRIFGEMLLRDIECRNFDILAISDSGFVEEAEVLIEKYGAENTMLVKITREGYDFSGDSRSYIVLDGVKISVNLFNSGDSEFEEHLFDIVNQFVNGAQESVTFGVAPLQTINTPGFQPYVASGFEGEFKWEETVSNYNKQFDPPVPAETFPDDPIKEDSDIQEKDYVFEDIVNDKPSLLTRLGRLIGIK